MKKQLILVLETTAAMQPHFNSIFTHYLQPIFRNFCNIEVPGQVKAEPTITEFALVTFNAHGPYKAFLVQRSGWTRSLDDFLNLLHSICFAGGDFNDAAVAEGLADALMLVPPPSATQSQRSPDVQRHCILIAASNPYPLPTAVYRPQMPNPEQVGNTESQPFGRLAGAAAVAKCFSYCPVTLSVISPKQIPKLEEIYNAGRWNARGTDPPLDNVKSLHHLVLISENFIEARAALSKSGTTYLVANLNPVKMEITQTPPVSGPPPTSNLVANLNPVKMEIDPAPPVSAPWPTTSPPELFGPGDVTKLTVWHTIEVNGSIMNNRQSVAVPSISQVTVKAEPSTIGSGPMLSAFHELACKIENIQEQKPNIAQQHTTAMSQPGTSQQGQPGMQSMGSSRNSAANMAKYVKIWEGNFSGQRQGLPVFITRLESYRSTSASETLAADWPSGIQIARLISDDHMNNKLYCDKADFLVFRAMNVHGFLVQLQEKKLCAVIQLPSQTLLLSVSDQACRLIGMLLPGDVFFSKQQEQVGPPQLQPQSIPQMQLQQGVTSIGGPWLSGTAQVALQNSSDNAISQIMAPSMYQGNLDWPPTMQGGLGMNQNMMGRALNQGSDLSAWTGSMMPTLGTCQPGMSQQGQPGIMAFSQQVETRLQSAQRKYIKIWEGNLSGQRQGQPVFITRLEGYRSALASETLAANWPSTIQIKRLISQDHMNDKNNVSKADFLVFRALNTHGFLGQLQEKKLCAVIQLPSQTLLLSVSDGKITRLIGMLFPGDMVVFKPQISSQLQQTISQTESTSSNVATADA